MDENATIDRRRLLGLYGRLRGFAEALNMTRHDLLDGHYVDDLDAIAKELGVVLGENMSHFGPPPGAKWGEGGSTYTNPNHLRGRVVQALRYLETVHHLGTEVIEIGTLFNAIRDAELRSRCADLLVAPGNFDRAINQATQVLEDRIRRKANASKSDSGATLVRKVIPQKPSTGTLRVSHNEEEQEGLSHICAGLMLAFRNPSHHQLTDRFSREDALKLCAFVDNLLRIIDQSELVQ